jgi:hypothetical protein
MSYAMNGVSSSYAWQGSLLWSYKHSPSHMISEKHVQGSGQGTCLMGQLYGGRKVVRALNGQNGYVSATSIDTPMKQRKTKSAITYVDCFMNEEKIFAAFFRK